MSVDYCSIYTVGYKINSHSSDVDMLTMTTVWTCNEVNDCKGYVKRTSFSKPQVGLH